MLYVGVDPGKTGGIAVLNDIGRVMVTRQMPDDDEALFQELVNAKAAAHGGIAAALEEVWTVGPQMGRSSAFAFGGEYRRVKMALVCAGIPCRLVRPQQWQAAIGCQTKGDKNISKRRAEELFGQQVKITHAIADALLIAEWRRRQDQP